MIIRCQSIWKPLLPSTWKYSSTFSLTCAHKYKYDGHVYLIYITLYRDMHIQKEKEKHNTKKQYAIGMCVICIISITFSLLFIRMHIHRYTHINIKTIIRCHIQTTHRVYLVHFYFSCFFDVVVVEMRTCYFPNCAQLIKLGSCSIESTTVLALEP